jgi:hypothetical protein
MSQHRYPPSALLGDYARALLGLALALPPLALLQLNPYVSALFAGLALLFLVFAWRTLLRQLQPVVVSDSAIACGGPFPVELRWAALDDLRLAYFATRRDGASGWMQLALRAGRRRLRLDSRIDGFTTVVERATRAAIARHLVLSTTTTANLTALGIAAAGFER